MNFLVEQKRLHIAPSYKGGYVLKYRFIFFALRMILRASLSAFSVTEHVFKTYISAISLKLTFLKPLDKKSLLIVDVSEKFNLHPNVWKATLLNCVLIIKFKK